MSYVITYSVYHISWHMRVIYDMIYDFEEGRVSMLAAALPESHVTHSSRGHQNVRR